MAKRHSFLSCAPVVFTLALGLTGCASSAANLRPAEITSDEGALYGRMLVTNQGEDVTGKCYVEFTDEALERKAYLSLDPSGWVFTAVKPGMTHLTWVACSLGSVVKYLASYRTNLPFDVPGGDTIAYFGDVQVELQSDVDEGAILAGVALGAAADTLFPHSGAGIQGPLVPPGQGANGMHRVLDQFQASQGELQRRYGAEAAALKPYASLAGKLALASGSPPASAAGFALGGRIEAAEASCRGAGLEWRKLDRRHFSCSGAPAKLDVAGEVELTAYAGAATQIAVNASSDGAAWRVLVPRFTDLVESLTKSYGRGYDRQTHALDDCSDDIRSCSAAGRLHTSVIWRWMESPLAVAIVLDGGPRGGAPSLSIVYRTEARGWTP